MERKIKVFISQPMHGLDIKDVKAERDKALDAFYDFGLACKWFTDEDKLVDVNMLWANEETSMLEEPKTRLWYLGRSIQTMADADYVIFVRGWSKARGCKVEFQVCEQYFKHHLYPYDNMCYVTETEDEPTIEGNIGHIWFGKNDA